MPDGYLGFRGRQRSLGFLRTESCTLHAGRNGDGGLRLGLTGTCDMIGRTPIFWNRPPLPGLVSFDATVLAASPGALPIRAWPYRDCRGLENALRYCGLERAGRNRGRGNVNCRSHTWFRLRGSRPLVMFLLLVGSGGGWFSAGCSVGRDDSADRRGARNGPRIVHPEFLEQWAATRRFSLGHPTAIQVTPDGSAVLFLRSGPRSFVQDLYEFDVKTGAERVLLTAEKILAGAEETLSAEERARRERMRLSARGIAGYELSDDGRLILVPLSGRLFVVERAGGRVTELPGEGGFPIDPRFSPDARYVACVRDGELHVIEIATGVERALTSGATKTLTNGLAEFVAQEEMDRREGYWWSSDSREIVYQQTSNEGVEVLHIADATHPEREPESWAYPRAGKKNADVRLGIIPVSGGETRWINWDVEKYPYLATVNWSKNAPLTILVQNREQTEENLLAIDESSGLIRNILLTESENAWLNLDASMPKWLADGNRFLWTAERGGRRALEIRDQQGNPVATSFALPRSFKDFVSTDESRNVIYVTGGTTPMETHVYRSALSGLGILPEQLTDEPGVYSARVSDDGSVFVLTGSSRTGRRICEVRNYDNEVLGSLLSVAEQPPSVPSVEWTEALVRSPSVPGRDDRMFCGNSTAAEVRTIGFHSAIVRPHGFSRQRKYPVLVYVYGGPGANTVTASPNAYLLQQWIADHGFIVVSIDGRGTPHRGREWERVIKNNVIDTPLADQVDALQALGRKYREMDMSRVGIYGWSFGGYFSAMAVMRRPDVFKAGVAGAPVADWLDYDTHYTERYLGLPDQNPEGYRKSSVLTYADQLERPLLIIHGTTDDNVYFTHALKMSDSLFRAGKHHEFLALSGFTHMVADPLVTKRLYGRIVEFFQEHLRK